MEYGQGRTPPRLGYGAVSMDAAQQTNALTKNSEVSLQGQLEALNPSICIAYEMAHRLQACADALFGSVPEPAEQTDEPISNSGPFALQLDRKANDLAMGLKRLDHQLRRLENRLGI